MAPDKMQYKTVIPIKIKRAFKGRWVIKTIRTIIELMTAQAKYSANKHNRSAGAYKNR